MPLVWCFNCCFILHVCFGCRTWIIILCVHELEWNIIGLLVVHMLGNWVDVSSNQGWPW